MTWSMPADPVLSREAASLRAISSTSAARRFTSCSISLDFSGSFNMVSISARSSSQRYLAARPGH
jgi:hypothetical protein